MRRDFKILRRPQQPCRLTADSFLYSSIAAQRRSGLVCQQSSCRRRKKNENEARSWGSDIDPYTDSLRAYFILRHIALAWDFPQLRPAVMATILESSYGIIKECEYVFRNVLAWYWKMLGAHAIIERVWDVGLGRYAYRFTRRWLAVEGQIWDAIVFRDLGRPHLWSWDVLDYEGDEYI
jgi:hypothetical protein